MSSNTPGVCSTTIANERVRVGRWDLAVGTSTGVHRHPFDYVVVPLTAGRLRVVTSDGTQSIMDLEPGKSYFRNAGAVHEVQNGGNVPLSFVEVEILADET